MTSASGRCMRWQWMFLAIVVGCTNWQTKSSFDATAVSREYRTYALLAADTMEPAKQGALEREVERQLVAKGLVPVAPGQQPDVLVVYDLARTQQRPMVEWGTYTAWGRSFGALPTARALAYGYHARTVVLRFVDTRTRQTFWRGSASSPVGSPASPQQLTTAVDDILKRFPSEAVAAAARPVG
jgi:uncharacterized protein DUF4136